MRFAVLGTGMVGRAIAARLVELGHMVVMGTRNPEETGKRRETGAGDFSMSDWMTQNPKVGLATFAEAALQAEMVVNATNGNGSMEALTAAGKENLNGKILVDISNPLDFSRGMPPTLSISNTDSLAEQIQRNFPQLKVVKTLNTVTAAIMVHPDRVGDGSHSIFLSGNDVAAKATVRELLQSFGWQDIIDLGDISTARGPEMYLPLWLRLWGAMGSGMLNIKVMR